MNNNSKVLINQIKPIINQEMQQNAKKCKDIPRKTKKKQEQLRKAQENQGSNLFVRCSGGVRILKQAFSITHLSPPWPAGEAASF